MTTQNLHELRELSCSNYEVVEVFAFDGIHGFRYCI